MNKLKNRIIRGESLAELRKMPSGFVDCVMTSPPYWALRDYGDIASGIIWDGKGNCKHEFEIKKSKNPMDRGEKGQHDSSGIVGKMGNKTMTTIKSGFCIKCNAWKGQLGLEPTSDLYIKHLCNIFDEVKRVLKDEGTCWVNLGDTYGGSHCGYGQSRESSGFQNTTKQTCYATNKNKPLPAKIMPKSLIMIPFRFAIEMANRGWILRNTIIWHKPKCMPSSAKDRFTVDFEYLFFFVKNKKYYFETQYEPCAKNSDMEYRKNLRFGRKYEVKRPYKDNQPLSYSKTAEISPLGRNKRTVWRICPKPFKEAHFAVYPEELCEIPIKAGCPEFICQKCGKPRQKIIINVYPSDMKNHKEIKRDDERAKKSTEQGLHTFYKHSRREVAIKQEEKIISCNCNAEFKPGIVLDPFCGSGTTLLAAKKLGRNYLGIDLNPDYVKMSKKRIDGYPAVRNGKKEKV